MICNEISPYSFDFHGSCVYMFAGRLPKWFGERPGKKKDDPETPEEEELKKNEEDEEPFGLDDEDAEEEVNEYANIFN